MGKLRNRFKRLPFNGFLTRWDGSGSEATRRGTHLECPVVFAHGCFPKVCRNVLRSWEGWDHKVNNQFLQRLSMQLAKRKTRKPTLIL